MFVKVKLDFDSTTKNDPTIIEMGNDTTISDLKNRMQDLIELPAGRFEMKTLVKTLQNNEKLCDVWREKNGSSITLSNDDFICFLQLYNDEEMELQRRHKERQKINNMPIETAPILLESSSNAESTTASSSSSESSSESDSESEPHSNKRKKKPANKSASKKHISSIESVFYSGVSEVYDNSSPIYDQSVEYHHDDDDEENQVNNNSTLVADHLKKSEEKEVINSKSKTNFVAAPCKQHELNLPQQQSSSNKEHELAKNSNKIPPYSYIPPNELKFIVTIQHRNEKEITKENSNKLMSEFYKIFRTSNCSSILNFNEIDPVNIFDGKFFLLCKDAETFDWVMKSMQYIQTYKATQFSDKLLIFCVVIPNVSNKIDISHVFDLLEKQNLGLKTDKWAIWKHRTMQDDNVENKDKAVSTLFGHDILHLYIDEESEIYLKSVNYKLKYCFWKIVFELIKNE